MKEVLTYIVDSFTNEPFKGNPAGVCLLEYELSNEQMLSIANELGHSETAFLNKEDGSNKYSIRFFSPKMEIPLCGHATLAASKVLFERDTEINQLHFVNIQNLDLMVKRDGEMISMEFPIYETTQATAPKELLEALGIETTVNVAHNSETNILLLEIESDQILKGLKPNFEALYRSHDSINGVLVTAKSSKTAIDFESRYFWPWSGTNEDPVTGGTHTFLTKYWFKRLHKKRMTSFQCSARSGFMEVELISEDKMTIKSMARIVLEGKLRI
jgi:PhzF family phenazine biosynthesis protein